MAIPRIGRREIAVGAILFALVWAVFGQACGYDFVTYDDNLYVYDNAAIRGGFSLGALRYVLTQTCAANWHPLTMLMHTLNCQLFGMHAGGHHAVNVLLHSIGAVLLFIVLVRLTNAPWRSGIVAGLFAIHPLRVESVAWISELKDVLSGVFFFLGLLAYLSYVARPSARRYLILVAVFALGLMAKPMLVTFPIALLLFDWWPLGRLHAGTARKLLCEKLPLALMSVAAAVVTYLAQYGQTGMRVFSLTDKIENAIVSYGTYLSQLIWPVNLIVFYPHPGSRISQWQVAATAVCLVAVSAAALFLRKRAPYFLMGWLWYLLLLVPVIGIVQVGMQSHADRYTYLPHIGIYIALVWGIGHIFATMRWPRAAAAGLACSVVAVLAVAAWRQTTFWKNGETLWCHALAVGPETDTAHWGLAWFYEQRGDVDRALQEYGAALAIQPKNVNARIGAGSALEKKGDLLGAIGQWQAALEVNPTDVGLRNRLGGALIRAHLIRDAVHEWNIIIEQRPTNANARNNVAWVLATSPDPQLRDGARAVALAGEAIRLRGENPAALRTLAAAYAENQQFDLAVTTIERAIDLAQGNGEEAMRQNLQALASLFRQHLAFRDPLLGDAQ